jgi:hypothetical protein
MDNPETPATLCLMCQMLPVFLDCPFLIVRRFSPVSYVPDVAGFLDYPFLIARRFSPVSYANTQTTNRSCDLDYRNVQFVVHNSVVVCNKSNMTGTTSGKVIA